MLYHCGLLDERPERNRTYQWVRRGGWDLPGTPADIEHERRVWLSMPGFSISFHAHTLGVDYETVQRHVGRDYDLVREDVAANWLSITREDAVKLSQMRPGTGHVPIISQLAIIDDLKRGVAVSTLAADYRVHRTTITSLRKGRVRSTGWVPNGFQLIRYKE